MPLAIRATRGCRYHFLFHKSFQILRDATMAGLVNVVALVAIVLLTRLALRSAQLSSVCDPPTGAKGAREVRT